jgi:hypothetical protein
MNFNIHILSLLTEYDEICYTKLMMFDNYSMQGSFVEGV